MPPKRPHPNPFGEDEDGSNNNGNGAASTPSPKRPRINGNAGPANGSAPSTTTTSAPLNANAQIAAAKAKVMALLAAKGQAPQQQQSAASSSLPPKPATPAASAAPAPRSGSSAAPAGKPDFEAMKKRIAEAKRAAEMKAAAAKPPAPTPSTSAAAAPARSDARQPVGLHPLLAQQSSVAPTPTPSTSYRGGRTSASPAPAKVNPYLPSEDDASPGPSSGSRRSTHRPLQFNRAGRHVQAAEEARREAELEALQQRIAERGRLAGLHDKLTGKERAIKRQPPPDVEWWDAELLPTESYECVPVYPPSEELQQEAEKASAPVDGTSSSSSSSRLLPLITSPDTRITHYIQHPIPIPAPSSTAPPVPRKGVMLTKREMKKMRRQRRAAEQQDKQDRIKMGLQAPDAPKVKLSNLMRVLTSEAVADPTKVEARVRREVAARRVAHERANAERALTGDEKWEKKQRQKELKEEFRGVWLAAWCVPLLAHPYHLATIKRSAKEAGLGGRCVRTRPGGDVIERTGEKDDVEEGAERGEGFSLVVVEGSQDGIKKFKKTMAKLSGRDPRDKVGGGAGGSRQDDDDDDPRSNAQQPFLGAMGDAPPPPSNPLEDLDILDWDQVSWSRNTFDLIHEGRVKDRVLPRVHRNAGAGSASSAEYVLRIVPGYVAGAAEAKEALPEQWRGLWDVASRRREAEGEE